MAYTNKNYLAKRHRAVQVAEQHYEPGRHDRCYKWVWRKHIHEEFNIEYDTFLRWLREERKIGNTNQRKHLS